MLNLLTLTIAVKKCEMPVAKINTILKDNLDSYECPVKVSSPQNLDPAWGYTLQTPVV